MKFDPNKKFQLWKKQQLLQHPTVLTKIPNLVSDYLYV